MTIVTCQEDFTQDMLGMCSNKACRKTYVDVFFPELSHFEGATKAAKSVPGQ